MPPSAKPRKTEISSYILLAFGVALVSGIFVLAMIAKSMATGTFYRNAEGKITQPTSRVPTTEEQAMAAFEAPEYTASIKPDAKPEAEQFAQPEVFRKAMEFYQAKQYLRAIPLLRVTSDRQPNALTPRFYLGISFLLADRVALGIKELRKVAAANGENPYRERAHFYLAKGLIARNDLPDARDQLQQAVNLHGAHETEAAQLLKQIAAAP